MRRLIPVLALVLSGCGVNPGKNPDPVEISGRVTLTGKPVSDVVFNLQPTGKGTQATIPVNNGDFKGSVTPGRYTYYISEGRNPANFRPIPEKYRSGSLDRQVDVGAGTTLSITLD